MPNTRRNKPTPELKGTLAKDEDKILARFPKAAAKFWKERPDNYDYEKGQQR
jgi:hypothetical protein